MALLAALLALASVPSGQSCLDVRGSNPLEALTGRLERHTYPGPPNYADVRQGDLPEDAYILTLERPICIDDGGEFADASQRFSHVQLFSGNGHLASRLRAGVGRRVRVTGSGFAAHTGHHHAPLVVDVARLRMGGR